MGLLGFEWSFALVGFVMFACVVCFVVCIASCFTCVGCLCLLLWCFVASFNFRLVVLLRFVLGVCRRYMPGWVVFLFA